MSKRIWVIQQKIMKGDWETIAYSEARTKADALRPYEHMNGRLRAVSEDRAQADYLTGHADNYRLAN